MEDSLKLADNLYVKISAVSDLNYFDPEDSNMVFFEDGTLKRFKKSGKAYLALVDSKGYFVGYFLEANFWAFNKFTDVVKNQQYADRPSLGDSALFFGYDAEPDSKVFFSYKSISRQEDTFQLMIKYGNKSRKDLNKDSDIKTIGELTKVSTAVLGNINAYGNYIINKKYLTPNGTLSLLDQNDIDELFDILYVLNELFKDNLFIEFLQSVGLFDILEAHIDLPNRYLAPLPNNGIDEPYHKLYNEEYFALLRIKLIEFRYWVLQFNREYHRINIDELIVYLVNIFPAVELSYLLYSVKLKILKKILTEGIWKKGDWYFNKINEEEAIVKIMSLFYTTVGGSINFTEVDKFMDDLQTSFEPNKETLFEIIYKAVDDPVFFGDDGKGNKGQVISTMYKMWLVSKYNPYKNNDENTISTEISYHYDKKEAPILLNYKSSTFLGIKFDDFSFNFISSGQDKVRRYISVTEAGQANEYGGSSDIVVGTYHMFQPISLMQQVSESLVSIPYISGGTDDQRLNNFIPVFYLMYKDDVDGISNVKQVTNLLFDILLTFTGVGNVGKIRYLRYVRIVEWGLPEFKIVIGIVEFTSGTLGLLTQYAGKACDSELCNAIKNVIFWLQIVSASADAITNVMIKRAAKRLKDTIPPSGLPDDFLENAVQRQEFESKIDQLANEAAIGSTTIRNRLKIEVKQKIYFANLDNSGKIKEKLDFIMIHTDSQLDDIIEKGVSLNLTELEIQGFIFISCKKGKTIEASVLQGQMDYWINVKNEGYPIGKFLSLTECNTYKDKVKQLVREFGLPISDIRFQGSCLRSASAKDIDIAIFVNEEDLPLISQKLHERLTEKFFAKNSNKVVPDAKRFEDYNKAVEKLNKEIEKGIIRQISFGKLEDGQSFITEAINRGFASQGSMDISIIIKKRGFDTAPYLKF